MDRTASMDRTDSAAQGVAQTMACKCCGGPAAYFGAVDFAKSCEDRKGKVLPPSGRPVAYHRCGTCGFLFSCFLDDWDEARLRREIYNDDYITVDPEFGGARAETAAGLLEQLFGAHKATLRVLDYGGGDGGLVRKLHARGFRDAHTADPFHGDSAAVSGRFDLMVCIEVVEHLARPDAAFATAAGLLEEAGAVLFSTVLQPDDIAAQGVGWWYAAPRNGHVSLHTQHSLEIITTRHGFAMGSFNETLHMAWRNLPDFAAHLLRPRAAAAPAGAR